MTIWFTSDTHFGHGRIIKYCNRPYKDDHEQTQDMIRKWNTVVKAGDTVFHLGDVAGKLPAHLAPIEMLNGNKHLILGNHDNHAPGVYLNAGFKSVHTMFVLSPCELWPELDDTFFLVHDPMPQLIVPNTKVLCGHVHHIHKFVGNAMNVGVDVHDFWPIQLSTVYRALERREDEEIQNTENKRIADQARAGRNITRKKLPKKKKKKKKS